MPLNALLAMPAPKRRGRPKVALDAAERERHCEAAALVVCTDTPMARLAERTGLSETTLWRWTRLALGYTDGICPDLLRKIAPTSPRAAVREMVGR